MKPHIFWDGDSWACCLDWSLDSSVWGFGDTPLEAYEQWNKRMGLPA